MLLQTPLRLLDLELFHPLTIHPLQLKTSETKLAQLQFHSAVYLLCKLTQHMKRLNKVLKQIKNDSVLIIAFWFRSWKFWLWSVKASFAVTTLQASTQTNPFLKEEHVLEAHWFYDADLHLHLTNFKSYSGPGSISVFTGCS